MFGDEYEDQINDDYALQEDFEDEMVSYDDLMEMEFRQLTEEEYNDF